MPSVPRLSLLRHQLPPFVQIIGLVIFRLIQEALCTDAGRGGTPPVSKESRAHPASAPLTGQQGTAGPFSQGPTDMLGSLGVTPLLLELSNETWGWRTERDGGQRFRAEVSSSRISQLRLEVTKSVATARACFPPVPCSAAPGAHLARSHFFSVTAEALAGWGVS